MKKADQPTHLVTITPGTILLTIALLLGLYFVYFIRQIVMMFFLALIVMSALNPSLRFLQKRLRIPKAVGIFLLYAVLIILLGVIIRVIVPPLVAEIPNLLAALHLPPLPENFGKFTENLSNLNLSLTEISNLLTQFQSSFDTVYSVINSTFNGIFSFFTILVMSSYLLLDRDNLHKKIVWFSRDEKHLALAKELVNMIEVDLGGWVRGQLFLMITIGVVTYVGLTLMGIRYALPLALAAGLLEILPNLGPTISAIPAIAIAAGSQGLAMGGFVGLFYLLVQSLENNLIVPKIMKDSVDVNPLITILSILVGLKVAGVVGALLAVPVYIIIRSVYSIWLREKENL